MSSCQPGIEEIDLIRQQNKIHHLYWFYIIQSIKNQNIDFALHV